MIHLDKAAKSKVSFVAALLAPVVMVQCVRLFVCVAPAAIPTITSSAGAAQPGIAGGPTVTPRQATPAQKNALAYLASHTPTMPIHSPMDGPEPVRTPGVAERSAAPSTPVSPPTQGPALVLNGILGRSTDSLASINHHIVKVGDEVVPGWSVQAIDSKTRTVTLSGPGGETRTISPDSPGR